MKNKKTKKDKDLLNWLKKGGREGSKKDFLSLVTRASQPAKTSQ